MPTPRAVNFIGSVYLALLDSSRNKVGGYVKAGNWYPLSLKVETEQKTMISAMRENAGQILWSNTKISGVTGSGTMREIVADTFAWVLSGTKSALSASGGSATAEAVTAILGQYVELAHRNVSAVVVQDVTDTTTYVLDTDYRLNAALGMIEAIDGGAISDTDVLHIDYTYAAETGNKIEVGNQALIRVAMKIDGENDINGEPVYGEFDSVVLGSASELNLITDPTTDYDEFPFNLTFETVTGASSPGRLYGVLD